MSEKCEETVGWRSPRNFGFRKQVFDQGTKVSLTEAARIGERLVTA